MLHRDEGLSSCRLADKSAKGFFIEKNVGSALQAFPTFFQRERTLLCIFHFDGNIRIPLNRRFGDLSVFSGHGNDPFP